MQKPQGYDEAVAYTGDIVALPAGGYICEIKQASLRSSASGKDMLVLCLDIAAGEYKGHFKAMFDSRKASDPNAKWPCIYNQLASDPKSISFFKGLITSIEESNRGYTWNWDENTLKGKVIGMTFRREQYQKNDGKLGWFTKPAFPRSASRIQEGDFTIPDDKLLTASGTASSYGTAPSYGSNSTPPGFSSIATLDDEDLPF